jgi:glycosyltransferase involved in cell wall biosynthesis
VKILLLTDGIAPYAMGGMQKHSANLAKYLTLAGVEVTLVHCVSREKEIPSDDEVNESLFSSQQKLNKIIGLKFPSMGKAPGHYLKESYRYSEMVFEKVKDELDSYDFIYGKGFSAWELLHKKSKGMKMPPIGVKFHGYEMFQKPPSFRAKIERLFLRKPVKWNTLNADYVFSYGAKITDLIKKIGVTEDKIIEIPSGIDNTWIRESIIEVSSPVKFVFLGRYERRKGIEELNDVLNDIIENNDFEFHFIGPIPMDKQIKNDKIVYHGVVQDKTKLTGLLDAGDVLVCPSHSEGMPNVILEGMARGMAVIATDVGAVRLLVSEKVGVLLKKIDKEELKQAIFKLSNLEPAKLLEMKMNSLELVSNDFKWESIAEQVIGEVKKVINV